MRQTLGGTARGDSDLTGTDSARAKEYRHVSTVLARENSDLADEQRLALARRLAELAPAQADSWWSVATQIDWMLKDLLGAPLAEHPLFPELIAAWTRAIKADPSDSSSPYMKGRDLHRAGLFEDAYAAFMLAGKTETAHPSDIEWPAYWHYEHAVFDALECGREDLALPAARAAIDAGAQDTDAASLIDRVASETERRPT